MKLTFLGATGTVTGSKYLIETSQKKYLVDCGLFQGVKNLRQRNWRALNIDASQIDAIFLTHAHIDHTGYLPRLINLGFTGPVYCTQGTFELCKILLPDSGYLQEEEARYANEKGYSKHKPALPLYTRDDAEKALDFFEPVSFEKEIDIFHDAKVKFLKAGHILGASSIYFEAQSRSVLFSGDLGRYKDLIMHAPKPVPNADYLIMESTYGDRLHDQKDPAEKIAELINLAVENGGTIVIPSFAVGRAQHVLHILHELKKKKQIPDLKTFLDSPMAINATKLYCEFADEHKLSDKACEEMCRDIILTHTPEQSRSINEVDGSKIIISASGMASGGRVLHHLSKYLQDKKNIILFVGFQAAGTRGRSLTEDSETIKIFGHEYSVNAHIENISGLSAHADYKELIRWLNESALKNPRVFITHGEKEVAEKFAQRLHDTFHWRVEVPKDNECFDL